MPNRTCEAVDQDGRCSNRSTYEAIGVLCPKHYQRMLRNGTVLSIPKPTTVERFWAKFQRVPSGCWEWTAASDDRGYGYFGKVPAYRFAYELLVGPIPSGLELDHLCRNPPCVNPAHMEPVTHRENVLRGTGPPAVQAKQTMCLRGHPLSGDNLYLPPKRPNSRQCKKCGLIRAKERRNG